MKIKKVTVSLKLKESHSFLHKNHKLQNSQKVKDIIIRTMSRLKLCVIDWKLAEVAGAICVGNMIIEGQIGPNF